MEPESSSDSVDHEDCSMYPRLKRHTTLASKLESSKKRPKHVSHTSHFCNHCMQNLALKVYRRHESLYKRTGYWRTKTVFKVMRQRITARVSIIL